jgi:hypothetical protein
MGGSRTAPGWKYFQYRTNASRSRQGIIGVGVGIGIGIEGQEMGFGHENLDVYRTSIEYVGWAYRCDADETRVTRLHRV